MKTSGLAMAGVAIGACLVLLVAPVLALAMFAGMSSDRAAPGTACTATDSPPAYVATEPLPSRGGADPAQDAAAPDDEVGTAPGSAAPGAGSCAAPWTGGDSGCVEDDPTSGGCLTGATRHALAELTRVFGEPGADSAIRAAGCWDAHAWNPSSDHPKGRACDFFPGAAGVFAADDELAAGWEVAEWFRANAEALQVSYVIWQGRIWSTGGGDTDTGWGQPYNGGEVYDPDEATGGHFDHVHVSFRR